ncbi:MAG: endolytic transglycosylase MltG [Firmicutes bacterium]|nr:endolytic transglycosylase MltG [Bacillota bacterium]
MGRKRRNSASKKKNTLLIVVLIVIAVIGAVIIGSSAYVSGLNKPFDENNENLVIIAIPTGSSTAKIGEILEENGIIGNAGDFKLYGRIKKYDGRLKAGEYSLAPSMNLEEIFGILVGGHSNTDRFTVPEGLTVSQTADILAEKQLINRDEFMRLIAEGNFDYQFIDGLPAGENRLEGFLFPETYEIFTSAAEEDIINRMLSQFDFVFTDEYYRRAEELGYSVYDIVTIASLIEREARVDEERETVASVIYNRLAAGQQLQIDATVQYALGEQKERLTYKDLEVDSPYNTYKVPGLPAGPICSPGRASIEAALYPADTNYYYYVLKSKDEITHNFAATYSEFLTYKSQYQNSFK